MKSKVCTECEEEKLFSEFHRDKTHKDGHRNRCKKCQNKLTKEYRQTKCGREKKENSRLKHKYGIALEKYNQKWGEQKGLCAVCKKPETVMQHEVVQHLCVDHNHKTGKIRKLLCRRCNRTLGLINEDINILQAMIKYLK